MNAADIARHRLHNQQIAGHAFEQPGQVVSWLGAVQAQDYPAARWAVGLRLRGATERDVERAIADRTIVRTWPMRGTLHLVATADVRWMLRLLAPRIVAGSAWRHRQLELDEQTFARSRELFVEALSGGRQLTRAAMYQVLEAAGISAAGQRGLHILWRLAQEGLLCFGAPAGAQPTFALLDEWIPAVGTLDHEAALAELTRRYFTGHGPATLQDFMWWSGLTAVEANAGLDMVKTQLEREVGDGRPLWMARDLPSPPAQEKNVFLLPAFDEYLLGYRDRGAVLDPAHAGQVNPSSNGVFSPIIVVDGRVAGTWKRAFTRGGVAFSYCAFAPSGANMLDAANSAAGHYANFVGRPLAEVSA